MTRGKYIVLEGAEGVGKTTQIQKIAEAMRASGLPVRTLREPDSQGDLTAREIRRLTQDPHYPMNTRTEVLLYNAARCQLMDIIENSLVHGMNCLVDRNYLTTLAVQFYGRGDVSDYNAINKIIRFAVGDTEPDVVIVFDASVATLKARAAGRGQGERFDNLDEQFLERVRAGYLWEAKQRDYPVIYCDDKDEDQVFKQAWQVVQQTLARQSRETIKPLGHSDIISSKTEAKSGSSAKQASTELPQKANNWLRAVSEVGSKPKPSFFTPSQLTKELAADYRSKMSDLIGKRGALLAKISDPEVRADVARRSLPLACLLAGSNPGEVTKLLSLQSNPAQNLARKFIKSSYQAAANPVELIDFYPKTEAKIVADLIYSQTDVANQDIAALVAEIPHRERAQLLLASSPRAIRTRYTFEVLADLTTLAELSKIEPAVELQLISPRFGFDVPTGLASSVLSDAFESIFDQSLNLYSKFQASTNDNLAQLLVLSGAKQRAKLSLSLAEVLELSGSSHADVKLLGKDMKQLVLESHPILAQLFDKKSSQTW